MTYTKFETSKHQIPIAQTQTDYLRHYKLNDQLQFELLIICVLINCSAWLEAELTLVSTHLNFQWKEYLYEERLSGIAFHFSQLFPYSRYVWYFSEHVTTKSIQSWAFSIFAFIHRMKFYEYFVFFISEHFHTCKIEPIVLWSIVSLKWCE